MESRKEFLSNELNVVRAYDTLEYLVKKMHSKGNFVDYKKHFV